MSGTNNGKTTVVQHATETANTGMSSDFSAAIASIGSAIGELKDLLPRSIEKAVTDAIASDSTNNAIYDAIASATYDSISDLHEDGKFGLVNGKEPSTEDNGGRGFTRAELLAIETLDENDRLVNSLSIAFEKSLERSKFNTALDAGSAASKAAVNTAVDTTAETVEGVGKTGLSVGLEATRGALDLVGQVPAGVIESVIAKNPGPLLDRIFGSLERTGGKLMDKGADSAATTADNVSSKPIDNVKKGTEDAADAARPPMPDNPPPDGGKYVYDEKSGDYVVRNEKYDGDTIKDTSGAPPVYGDIKTGSDADASDEKVKNDLTLKFLTVTAPGFMAKGNEVFDQILYDGLHVHVDNADEIGQSTGSILDSAGNASKRSILSTVLKGGGIAALGAATVAAIGAIGVGVKGVVELASANREAEQRIKDMTELARQANEDRKKGVNDELRDATQASIEADNELAIAENSIFGASQEQKDKATSAKNDLFIARRRYEKMREQAKEYGVDVNNLDAFTKWQTEQKELAKAAGIDVEDGNAFARFRREELERYRARKKAMDDGTRPSGSPEDVGSPGTGAVSPVSVPGKQNEVTPLAAGTTVNNVQDTIEAGNNMMTQDVLTAETQMQQYRQFTFEGIRDALLLPEVRDMFISTARTAGTSVEQQLMG